MLKKYLRDIKLYLYIFILVAIDQVTKFWATNSLKDSDDIVIFQDILHLHYLDGGNTGAAWGMLSGKITFLVICTIIWLFIIFKIMYNLVVLTRNNYSLKKSFTILKYVIATLLAGALGNFIDRVVLGYVVDFIYFKLINFPIFNVADCFVTVSAFLIVIVVSFCYFSGEEFSQIFSLKFKRNKNDK